jgi:diguanylate cyclase (GGDEF)-like protein
MGPPGARSKLVLMRPLPLSAIAVCLKTTNLMIFATIGLSLYIAAAFALNIPSNIRLGWKGQAAIRMLDEMRRPFLALKEAQNRGISFANDSAAPEEGIDRAIQAGRALMAQYLRLAQYNPTLEQDVQTLSKDFDKWAVVESELAEHWAEVQAAVREAENSTKNEPYNYIVHHIKIMSEAEALFLKTMNDLGKGERPIHADIMSGSEAERNLLSLSILFFSYLVAIVFWNQRMEARAQKEKYEKELSLQHLAYFDGLTDLPNLMLFRDRLSVAITMARRSHTEVAVLYVDLDYFKQINDRFGHDAGDRVLKEVATRLRSCVRDTDTVARLGGDEFVILLTNIQESSNSVEIAKKLISSLGRPFDFGAVIPSISASIGIAHCPRDGQRYEELVKAADAAMYSVKKIRTGGYHLASDPALSFSSETDQKVKAQRRDQPTPDPRCFCLI